MIHSLKNTFIGCFFTFGVTFYLSSCDSDDSPQRPIVDPEPDVVTIDPVITNQTIAGFGGANQMWGNTFPNAGDMKQAFGMGEEELGMSIFRVRIASNPGEWPRIVNVAKEAQSYGAKILASPWSPPPAMKSNGSDVGGHLLEEYYEDFVEHINEFIQLMADNDVDIYAISIQNEPDIQVSYESCDWSATKMRDFIKNYGHLIEGAKVAAPESFNFNQTYTNVILNDDEAVANLDIVAGHIYGSGQNPYPLAEQKGKVIWMTEYLLNLDEGDWENADESEKWEETMTMLNTVHRAMTNNWNAYIWWYLKRYYSFLGDGVEGTVDGEILKRGYAFSHYSKFVRPGYVRIDAKDERNTGLKITAYKGNDKIVVVLINDATSSVTKLNLSVSEGTAKSATSYTTALSLNREKSELEINEGNAVVSVPPMSVTTVIMDI